MKEENAKKIVEIISKIAEAQSSIRLNCFCENSDSAVHNNKILKNLERELESLFLESKMK